MKIDGAIALSQARDKIRFDGRELEAAISSRMHELETVSDPDMSVAEIELAHDDVAINEALSDASKLTDSINARVVKTSALNAELSAAKSKRNKLIITFLVLIAVAGGTAYAYIAGVI